MRYKWLLFDLDGTLFDYDKAEAAALEKAFEQAGHRFQPGYAQVYRRINERIWQEFEQGRISQARLRSKRFELLFDAIDVHSDPVTFSTTYLKNLARGWYLVPDAKETVESLYGKVGLLIITNGLKEVQRPRLASSAIGHYFSGVVISEEAGAAKPDRRIFDIAFSKMNDPEKKEVLIVGDGLTSDIKGGNDYGIDTCWFNPAQRPHSLDIEFTYEIGRLKELADIVEGT